MNVGLMKLALDCPATYEEIRLTEPQRNLIKRLDDGEQYTTNDVSELLHISINSASSRLKALVRKGYLIRKNIGDPTGGSMFLYQVNPSVSGKG